MKSKTCLLACAGLLGSCHALASDYDPVRDRISSMVSGDSEITIAETPIDGLLQVRVGSEFVYMTTDGRFLIQGRVLDLDSQTDLTDAARAELRREALASLDRTEWISFGPEDAEHEILVFTDPDCGYCRRLHQQMDEYNGEGIRIHYLAFPRAGVGSSTYEKLISIWCAEDQHAAMDTAKAGQTPEPASCDSPVVFQYELGQKVGVTGTPALMTLNGELIPGYVPPAQLKARLEQLSTNGPANDR